MYANQILEELRTFWEAAVWREDLHPRASDGKFGSGGPSPSSSTSKPAGKAKTGAASKTAAAKPAAPKKAPAAKKTPTAKPKKAPTAPPPPPPPAKDQAWLDSHYSGYQKSLTPGQRKALSGYQGADYGLMNAQLRSTGRNGVKDDRFDDAEMARAARSAGLRSMTRTGVCSAMCGRMTWRRRATCRTRPPARPGGGRAGKCGRSTATPTRRMCRPLTCSTPTCTPMWVNSASRAPPRNLTPDLPHFPKAPSRHGRGFRISAGHHTSE
ncbi:hypothetical protein [Streptosporangium sp. NPDC002721]|uniref:hypothetical protein n=1 Tax=Streptosporangium sp. NPDC002721 TaxID=3366188 RepID=UPI0036BB62CC